MARLETLNRLEPVLLLLGSASEAAASVPAATLSSMAIKHVLRCAGRPLFRNHLRNQISNSFVLIKLCDSVLLEPAAT